MYCGVAPKGATPYFFRINDMKSCCFIGHKHVEDEELVISLVRRIVEALVKEEGVRNFHFGSVSDFNDICYDIVLEMRNEYPDIVRIAYNLNSEVVFKEEERHKYPGRPIRYCDESRMSERLIKAGRAAYVERNQDMINDSDICIFYYIEGYKARHNPYHYSNNKSGAKIAYEYALSKNKRIINIVDMIK